MKKNLLLSLMAFALFSLAHMAEAQIQQGNLLVGGNLSFDLRSESIKNGGTRTETGNTISFGLAPSAGFFVTDNIVVGTSLNLFTSRFKSEDEESIINNSGFSVGPFVRYYLPNNLYFTANVGFGRNRTDADVPLFPFENTQGIFTYRLGVGYAVFLTESIALEPLLTYNSTRTNGDVDDDNDIFGIERGLSFSLSFNLYLPGKTE